MARGRKRKQNEHNESYKPSERRAPLGKECSVCHDIISRNLVQHEKICKLNRASRRQVLQHTVRKHPQRDVGPHLMIGAGTSESQPVNMPMEDLRSPAPAASPEPDPMDVDPVPPSQNEDLQLPTRFIYVKHHPHSAKPDEIIPLDSECPSKSLREKPSQGPSEDRPWAPFQCLADSTFTYRCVSRRMPNKDIDEDLKYWRTEWADNVHVSFRNHREMERSLAAAREGNVRFHTEHVSIDFQGREFSEKSYEVEIHFRDPWEVMKRWIRDETLVPVSTWFSQERYLCLDGKIDFSNPLYDEPCTGTTWRKVDDALSADERYPSCYLGGHFWLDKGLVSTKVKMHPMLLRGCWIQSATRNGSGNGGAALLGFVVMPPALREIDAKTLRGARRAEYDALKRKVYHTVCRVVLASLGSRSRNGETIRFGDGVTRTAYPGVLIESMDFEELAAWLAIRNSRANHPCPKCLVHHDDLHKLSERFDRRTSESMKAVLARTKYLSATEREELLKSYGLQNFEHFLWTFDHSDPYAAAGYDLLHYFDGGKWGRHVWVTIKEYLQTNMLASKFNDYMNQFPRWRGLKHTPSPTTIDYSEGQTFVDILKCALPCLVQLLPRSSCLVRIVRVMQEIRIMLGLWVTFKTRLDHLQDLERKYESACNEVHKQHGKDFNFLKQHSLIHAIDDFVSKGTSRNMTTRVGEGFQQEVEKMYHKTNGKRAERQISLQDENEEAMARIKMAVDEWRQRQEDPDIEEDEHTLISAANDSEAVSGNWTLGSPEKRVSTHQLEAARRSDPAFRNFNLRLREYLACHHPSEQVRLEQQIQIEQCKVVYVAYQSKVDWRSARDILRCNSHFHNAPRFDCVIFETDDDPIAIGELQFVFRCHLPGGAALDLALVRPFRKTSWQPNTRTNCPIREKMATASCGFIALEHVVRGTLLCPIFGGKAGMHYIIDCIDEDMYLRINSIN
ncbi:hypothetical protein B0H15DRAFT_859196 [Mycena belliarum]|uniref:Uncharacterized protein n=1 Tax=Mycena belliarum TaxID=1033014 RepID=A0AAD6TYV5_9AGAR|nr:hypothetical protein B0H15DRAFT_859196 [Mycena belliae]